MDSISIRPANADDAAAIARIHNEAIADRVATLETMLRTPAERRDWLQSRSARHPVVVAQSGGEVVGWASLNQFNPRDVYDHVADFSVYVARESRGQRIGSRLLDRLVELARELGYHKMVLAALAHNAAGTRLYKRTGFSDVGIYREQGQLDGRWVDVVIMEKLL